MNGRVIQRRSVPGVIDLPASLHPVLRRIYGARGLRSAEQLDLGIARLLPVSTLDGIELGAAVLLAHIERDARILVVGDFDADGATSTALVLRQLRRLGCTRVVFRVPDRMRHGYGLTPALVADLESGSADLLITVDNGVAAVAGVEAARAKGMEVLVTDHHLPGAELPRCAAMVNPNLHGASFGSRALAGVGVAFYLMAAVTRELEARRGTRQPAVSDLLDLVALGTIADLVPLDWNNRILVWEGLRRLRAGRTLPGIAALAEVSGRRLSELSTRDLGFLIAPRLNAAGRIDDMAVGIRCLLADDPAEARSLALQLDQLNKERRALESQMRDEATEAVRRLKIAEGSLPDGLTLHDEGWHPGIVGLVAGRIKDRVHRPVVAFAPAGAEELRGSARSVAGVHIRDVLEAIDVREPGLIERFGGHAMAAGLTLRPASLARFTELFAEETSRWLPPPELRGVLQSDGELGPGEISLETAEVLETAGPWGQGFPEPMFDGVFGVTAARIVGGRHLKLGLRVDGWARPLEGIAFGYLEEPGTSDITPGQRVRLAYQLQTTDYGGPLRPELRAEYVEKLP